MDGELSQRDDMQKIQVPQYWLRSLHIFDLATHVGVSEGILEAIKI